MSAAHGRKTRKGMLFKAWTERKQRIILCAILMPPLPIAALRLVGDMTMIKTGVLDVLLVLRDIRWINTVRITRHAFLMLPLRLVR